MGKKTGEDQAAADGGRWPKGHSGNPAGRPRGARNKLTRICADLLSADAEQIMAALVTSAKGGDGVALKLCIDRLLPARAARDRIIELDGLPAIARAQDLVAAAAAVIARAAAGEITLSEAKEFMGLLEVQRRAIETSDLQVRIEALESEAPRGPVGFAPPEGADPSLTARVRRLFDDRGGRS